MRTTVPDERGWFWAKDRNGRWFMTFVDTNNEIVLVWDGEEPNHTPATFDMDDAPRHGGMTWFGPFQCPGGPFGGATIVCDEDLHNKAAEQGEAIVVQYISFEHCRDEKHHASVAVASVQPRAEAERVLRFTEDSDQCQ